MHMRLLNPIFNILLCPVLVHLKSKINLFKPKIKLYGVIHLFVNQVREINLHLKHLPVLEGQIARKKGELR